MFAMFRKGRVAPPVEPVVNAAGEPDLRAAVQSIGKQASSVGRDAAEVRGLLDDASKVSARQAQAVLALAGQLGEVTRAQQAIGDVTAGSLEAVGRARDAVEAVGTEVSGIVDTLREVA